ncbi:hypothetical protein TCAL_10651 [Tigriopus californicus]|uniref:LITAF domain-containing protein n=1 Tax=Tigriopus californicus TaxID=6832 RepID=A0A553PMH5_TIGCA|nr:lipopolysaccharide-induced tumor necrosis factor-alpha factor homolog [Tigriopus californicus]TRY78869.1 hypothetical protein TCAL_10651 [Tigriopus californicus]|eukprot:TCALIF_10651-PA protein Name:"Similar to litaf Lipopolysaccharide-induced tumor necrosis factor-alpha factor homolog (Xenopus tropicalis)" AED:0.00 eAED:0.00 QI:18/1/1/1/1/1/3/86/142
MSKNEHHSSGGFVQPQDQEKQGYNAAYPPLPPSYEESNHGGYTYSSNAPPPAQEAQQIVVPLQLGDEPAKLKCPQCHQMIKTRVTSSSGLGAWLACAGCAIFGLVFGCCLIPFCIDSMKVYNHYCPSCNTYLGRFKGSASMS